MFLNKFWFSFFVISLSLCKPVICSDSERTPQEIVANFNNWREIKFIKGGISFKVPREFVFESDEPNPAEDIAVLMAIHHKKKAKLETLMMYIFRYPRENEDPLKIREKSLDTYVKDFLAKQNALKTQMIVFNHRDWKLVDIRPGSDKKRPSKVAKYAFHKIISKNKETNGRIIKISLTEHNNVDVCPPGNEPPCGPTTEKFYSWPIIEKILESVEYIE